MRGINRLLLTSAITAMLCLTASQVMAQQDNQGGGRQRQRGGQGGGRQGNFDPAQMQERMMQRYREQLEVTDDQEWKAIQPRVQKVLEARRAVGTGGRGMLGRGGRQGGDANQTDQGQRRSLTRPNPAAEALRKAVDSKASTPEIKATLAKYLDDRKARQADLEKAQEELRGVLTSRQEAIAALSGLL